MFVVISAFLMLIFIASRKRFTGFLAWLFLSIEFLSRIPYFLSIRDYFNTAVFSAASAFFVLVGFTVLKCRRLDVLVQTSSFSLLAILFYFPFSLNDFLKYRLIETVVDNTVLIGNALGYPLKKISKNLIILNGRVIEIILACTGIESMSLFAGATLGIRAGVDRKLKAFLISVPTIYVLNLFRNVFVIVSYGFSWFGQNSFYIAHHVISKTLALAALILITLAVFRILPELENLIYNLKDEISGVLGYDRGKRD